MSESASSEAGKANVSKPVDSEASRGLVPPASALPRRSAWEIQRAVVFALFVRELKTRFGGRWLGAFWVLLEPLAHIFVMLLIFGYVRNRVLPGVEYPVFLLTGLVPFFLFRNLALRGMQAIDANRGLFGYRQVKPLDPLLSRAVLETLLYSVVYLLTLAALGWLGFQVLPARPLQWLGTGMLLIASGFGLGLLFAVLTDELPNARSLIGVAFLPLYLASGIIFPLAVLPREVLPWLLWNPVLHAIELSRGQFFPQYHALPEVSALYLSAFALTALALAMSVYRVRRQSLLAT